MYDEVIKKIELTYDETEILKVALERYQETCVGRVEEFTVEQLLEKLDR